MTHITCRLTAKNRDQRRVNQLRNPALGNRVWVTFTFMCCTCDPSEVSTWGWRAAAEAWAWLGSMTYCHYNRSEFILYWRKVRVCWLHLMTASIADFMHFIFYTLYIFLIFSVNCHSCEFKIGLGLEQSAKHSSGNTYTVHTACDTCIKGPHLRSVCASTQPETGKHIRPNTHTTCTGCLKFNIKPEKSFAL